MHVHTFMKDHLFLPEALLDERTVVKTLTIIFPCSTRLKLPGENYTEDRTFLTNAFRNNNFRVRNKFFSEPIVRYLWGTIFVEEEPQTCIQHLKRTRSSEQDGEAKYQRFLTDLREIEVAYMFKILPTNAWEDETNKVFT